ncbi:MAG: hypothetical protein ACK5AQ_08920 [Bacteroidota bacterium]|jgi:hypothetical protein
MQSLLLQLFALSYVMILFGQTSGDKLFNWKANDDYVKAYFLKSPLSKFSGILFRLLFLLEAGAFLFATMALINLFLIFFGNGYPDVSGLMNTQTALFMDLALLGIFLGQRLAKDYASAASSTIYLVFAMGATWVLTGNC